MSEYPNKPSLESIPSLLEGHRIFIPTYLNNKDVPQHVLCKTCVEAHSHACFIINGKFLLKWDDAVKEAKRLEQDGQT